VTIRWDAYRTALPSIAHAVGRTPLVRLNRVTAGLTPPVFLKLEWYGATGSLKDRIYLHMFERAEQRGDLRPGMRVLECSTGNAGIACAFVAAMKGYPCTIVMPEGMSDERKKIMRAYGAELVFTPGGESDVDLALQRLAEIRAAAPTTYWVPGQFDNPDNVEAHYTTTGPEIWEQCGGRVGAFVDAQGSGGTLSGVGRFLRERDRAVRLYAVEPAECALLARREWGPHGIEGIGDGFIPENLDVSLLSGVITTTTAESVEMARRLSREEGIFCGISTGCNVAAALKLAGRRPELAAIVTMANDTGQRYFTTALCGEDKRVEVPEREHPMDERTRRELDRHQPRWEVLT
jgi:cysteine synthase A